MSGLVGWWPLHETSGDKAYDLSGNENHGAVNGPSQGVAGRANLPACSFDSSDADDVLIGNPENLSFSSAITVSAWIRPNSVDDDAIISQWASSGDEEGRSILFDINESGSSGYCRFFISYDGDDWARVVSNTEIPMNEWTHVVGVYDGNTIQVWIDGGPDNQTQEDRNIYNASSNWRIGERDQGGYYFDGSICDLRIYNRALSPSEIQGLYRQGSRDLHKKSLSDGSDVGAVSRWKLEDGGANGSTAVDSWGSNNGTINGASFTDDSVRNDGKALQFDGEDDSIDIEGALSFVQTGTPFSLSAWIKTDDDDHAYLVGSQESSSSGKGFQFGFHDDGRFLLRLSDGSDREEVWYSDENVRNGEWSHITAMYDGSGDASGIKLYHNGVQVDSDVRNSDGVGEIQSETNHFMAARIGDQIPYEGQITDVRIFDRVLSSREVFELYRWGSLGKDMRKELVNKRGGGQ